MCTCTRPTLDTRARALGFRVGWDASPHFLRYWGGGDPGVSSCLTANPATALQPGWFEDSLSLNFRLPGSPTHEGKFPTHVPGNCMHRGLQEHRWETAFGSFLYDPVLWARPGWFEDSFSLKCGLPGNAGSVPTVLHDATDTGTDYIFGGGQGCQNDTQGLQNSRKMNPARLV